MIIHRVVAELKIIPKYRCTKCNCVRNGTTRRMSFDTDSVYAIARQVEETSARSADMPVGWSFNGQFHCEGCMQK